jgi:uncharacterized protein YukE
MTYLDVDTDAVSVSGRNTAGTSGTWQTWAGQSGTAFREAVAAVKNGTVGAAVETYASNWNPRLQGLATQVDTLGRNTTSASNVVYNADGSAVTLLNQQGAQNQSSGSYLTRPITA